jgi:hypothetical protein
VIFISEYSVADLRNWEALGLDLLRLLDDDNDEHNEGRRILRSAIAF